MLTQPTRSTTKTAPQGLTSSAPYSSDFLSKYELSDPLSDPLQCKVSDSGADQGGWGNWVGGLLGGAGGMATGGVIGSLFGPVGTLVGAAAGGATGASVGEQVGGATQDFVENYMDMREADTIGADKYFHCKANCEAAQEGGAGETTGGVISEIREWSDATFKGDSPEVCNEDRAANQTGRDGGSAQPDTSCSEICSGYRPNGLDDKY